jgi:hypothetical protein
MNRDAEDRMFRTAPEIAEAISAEPIVAPIVAPVTPMVSRSDGFSR